MYTILGESIIAPLDCHLVVYPGGAGLKEGAGVEEVSLVYLAPLSTPAPSTTPAGVDEPV